MAKQSIATGTTPLTPATVRVPPWAGGADVALFPVVGIGASAGGLEALTELFSTMASRSGMAFVVVTHLDPDHKSAMAEILSHFTTMVVGEVRDGTELQADHVYVIPPNTNMVVEGNRLRLAPRGLTPGLHLPVDVFLQSLAVARNSQAVGVILSGTGTDGTLGLKAIKGQGGITFVQDDTAEHDGMPRSAFNAGCVDFVMSPRLIATELSRLGSHPHLSGGLQTSWGTLPTFPASEASESTNAATEQINAAVSTMESCSPDALPRSSAPTTDEADFHTVVRLLSAAVGVDFTHYKAPTLRRRIERRMVLGQHATLQLYAQRLQDDPAELQALFQEVLIQVTRFFRDPDMFLALRETVWPKLVAGRPTNEPLRVWVPGCSTGEEAYSLAISLLEFLREQGLPTPIRIFGTDISERAIGIARAGVYLDSIADDVSPERLRRYFVKTDGHYQIQKRVRDLCVFARQDVTKDPPFSQLDLISCRNVLIYLGLELQYRVLPIFHYALQPGGVLVLGESESVGGFTELFDVLDKSHRFFLRRETLRRETLRRTTFDFTPGRTSIIGPSAFERASDPGRSLLDVQREADRIVLAKYAPAGVVVDDSLQIVQFRGQTGMYLEPAPGTPNFDLLQMARDGLLVALREALEAARRDGVPQHCDRIFIRSNDESHESHEISLEVLPLLIPAASKRFFVVLFSCSNTNPQRQRGRLLPDAPDSESLGSSESLAASALAHAAGDITQADLNARDHEVARLRQELDATKSYLQSVIEAQEAGNEELTAANEEIISSNEELQSTNEELETAKEELQATNEELTTVNEELQCRIAISAQLSDDLTNLMDAVNIPTVLLDRALLIRRFSPSAQNLFRLISSDIGRPIGDFKLKINVPDLEPLLQQVIQSLEMQQREVQDTDGRWHRLVVRPYKTTDNKIDGAIIKLSDIDALKRREHELEVSRDYAVSIVESGTQPLVVLDAELRIQLANRAFYESFQVTREETEQRLIYSLGNGQWNIPRLREMLEDILPLNTSFDGFELEHTFPAIGHRSMVLKAHQTRFDTTRSPHILLSFDDLTERRRIEQSLHESLKREQDAVFDALFDNVSIGTAQGDSTGKFIRVNDRYCEMTGYSREELLGGMSPLDLDHPDDREQDERKLNAVLIGEARFHRIEKRYLSKSGKVVWVRVSLAKIDDDFGVFRCTAAVIEDITARKRTEELLQDSERLLRLVIDTVPHYIGAKNREGQFLFANRAVAQSSGFESADELVGLFERDSGIDQAENDLFFVDDRKVIDSGLTLFIPAEPVTDFLGQTHIMQTTKVPFLIPGTNEPAVLAVSVDITEQRRLQQQVLEISDAEQQRIGRDLHDGVGQELTGLGFLASHLADSLAELSLPGSEALVEQAAGLLVSSEESSRRAAGSPKNSPSPEAAFLAHAAAYTATAKKLVEGLDRALKQVREVSKGLIPVELSAEGLQLALEDLAANITAQTRVTCRFTGSAEIDDSLRAKNLFRIAQEATTNAIKHSHANLITLSLDDEDEGHITLSICDNGIGFPGLATATSGLGLKTMRYRASLIGAKLTIDSTQDRGTRITCTLDKGLPK